MQKTTKNKTHICKISRTNPQKLFWYRNNFARGWLVVGIKAICPLVGPGPAGGVPSEGSSLHEVEGVHECKIKAMKRKAGCLLIVLMLTFTHDKGFVLKYFDPGLWIRGSSPKSLKKFKYF